jgi:RNA polymerase sigma-70 factor (ECF subfamily)
MKRINSADADGSATGARKVEMTSKGPEGEVLGVASVTTSGVRRQPWTIVLEAYDAHEDDVWRFIARKDVEDAEGTHQEVFMQYYMYVRDHAEPDDVPAWLHTTAKRLVIKDWRRRARHPHGEAGVDGDAFPDRTPDQEMLLDEVRVARASRDAVARLPEHQGALIREIDFDGEDVSDVAGRLGRPEPTIRSRLNRARASFRTLVARLLRRGGGR